MPKIIETDTVLAMLEDLKAKVVAGSRDEVVATAPAPTPTPTPTPAPSTTPMPVGAPGTFSLLWRDEFDAPLDPKVWNTNWLGVAGKITKPIHSAELAAYDPAQVSVANSCLVLSSIKSSVVAADGKTYAYRSGCIESYSGSQKPGKEFGPGHYFEFKVQMDGAGKVLNNWGATWLNGHHTTWPDRGENDVMENLSGGPAWHYHAPGINNGADGSGTDYSGWHTYGCDWQAGRIDYYYDGKLVGSQTSGVLSYPNYFVLNYGISTQHGGPLVVPGKMLVDYVRVWKKG